MRKLKGRSGRLQTNRLGRRAGENSRCVGGVHLFNMSATEATLMLPMSSGSVCVGTRNVAVVRDAGMLIFTVS